MIEEHYPAEEVTTATGREGQGDVETVGSHEGSGELVLRRSWSALGRGLVLVPGTLALGLGIFALNAARVGDLGLVLVVVVATLLVMTAATVWYMSVAAVVVTPTEVGHRTFLGSRRMRPRSDVTKVVVVDGLEKGPKVFRTVFLLDQETRPIVRMHDGMWEGRDIDRLIRELSSDEVDRIEGRTAPAFVRRRYPKAVKWGEANPSGASAVAALAGIGTVILLIIVLSNTLD